VKSRRKRVLRDAKGGMCSRFMQDRDWNQNLRCKGGEGVLRNQDVRSFVKDFVFRMPESLNLSLIEKSYGWIPMRQTP